MPVILLFAMIRGAQRTSARDEQDRRAHRQIRDGATSPRAPVRRDRRLGQAAIAALFTGLGLMRSPGLAAA
jgi:hypothetical protein